MAPPVARRGWRPHLRSQPWWMTRGWPFVAGVGYATISTLLSSAYLGTLLTRWSAAWFAVGGVLLVLLAIWPERDGLRAITAGVSALGPASRGLVLILSPEDVHAVRSAQLVGATAWLLIAFLIGFAAVATEPYARRGR